MRNLLLIFFICRYGFAFEHNLLNLLSLLGEASTQKIPIFNGILWQVEPASSRPGRKEQA